MPDTYHPVKAGLRNTHSTPRALNRQLTAEKSFSEPPAEHLEPVLDIQPASDCAPSLPLWMQQRPHESRPKAGKPGSHAPAPDVSVPRNVRVLSQPEFISAKSHFESTAESATVAIDVSAEGSKPPVHRPRKEPAFPSAGREDQTMRAVSGSAGRLTAGPAGSTRRGKTVSSPQSTGLSAGGKLCCRFPCMADSHSTILLTSLPIIHSLQPRDYSRSEHFLIGRANHLRRRSSRRFAVGHG